MLDSLDVFEDVLDITPAPVRRRENVALPAVDILAIATATPEYKTTQAEAFQRVKSVSDKYARLEGIYTGSAIETRYSCVSPDWCERTHGWEERAVEFKRHAVSLLEKVALKAIAEAGLTPQDIDVLVTNSTTGVVVPSLDALLINKLDLKETVTRLPIFGFGCSGGLAGMARATQLAQAMPGANVLFLTVDLCSLAVRSNDHSLTNFVAAALFGDGAAGLVLRSSGRGDHTSHSSAGGKPRIRVTGERLLKNTEGYLGLDTKDDGFGMVLSPQLPALVRENLGPAVDKFLGQHNLSLMDFDGFLVHAGGRKILENAEEVLGTSRDQMAHAWSVMRDYGNMSSATVLFVLERAMQAGAKGRHLMAAFGYGFSVYFAVVDL